MPLPRLGELTTATEQMPFLIFGKPDIGFLEKEAVMEVLDSGWLSTGTWVASFEEEFKTYLRGGFPVAVSSCTDGLILSLLAAGIGHGDEVLTTPLTFAATVNAILAVGAKPIFVDVTTEGLIDPEKIEAALMPSTKAIIPVHYTGAPCDMDRIMEIAKRNEIVVIEDAAHGFGGTYGDKGAKIGTRGDFACFSFYPTKNITSGEGGMVVCRTEASAQLVRTISMQGLSAGAHQRYGAGPVKPYHIIVPGRKANLSDIHAAIGVVQLHRWPEISQKRAAVWRVYEQAFGRKQAGHSQHLFTINVTDRNELRQNLHRKGIGTGIHFNPLHLEPAYSSFGYGPGSFRNAEILGSTTLSLPVSSTMTEDDARRVVDAVNQ